MKNVFVKVTVSDGRSNWIAVDKIVSVLEPEPAAKQIGARIFTGGEHSYKQSYVAQESARHLIGCIADEVIDSTEPAKPPSTPDLDDLLPDPEPRLAGEEGEDG